MSASRNVVKGFDEDKDRLYQLFSDGEQSFASFSSSWREMKFSFIFCGLTSEAEVKEFVSNAFSMTLKDMDPRFHISRRISAFYLLYSIYYKQPLDLKTPVRMAQNDITNVNSIINYAKENGMKDPQLIWNKMLADDVVDFVAIVGNVGPFSLRNRKKENEDVPTMVIEDPPGVRELEAEYENCFSKTMVKSEPKDSSVSTHIVEDIGVKRRRLKNKAV